MTLSRHIRRLLELDTWLYSAPKSASTTIVGQVSGHGFFGLVWLTSLPVNGPGARPPNSMTLIPARGRLAIAVLDHGQLERVLEQARPAKSAAAGGGLAAFVAPLWEIVDGSEL